MCARFLRRGKELIDIAFAITNMHHRFRRPQKFRGVLQSFNPTITFLLFNGHAGRVDLPLERVGTLELVAGPELDGCRTESHAVRCQVQPSPPPQTLHDALHMLAKLGGYLARVHDPPPGNLILWRGLAPLTNTQIGFLIAQNVVGK